jgi:dTDP-4-dehydrorhamnose 3,5-epimerase-like enzyme
MKVTKPTFEFSDQKGWFKEVSTGNWKHLNLAFRKKGTWSADHYHKDTTEMFYTVYGECDFIITDVKTRKVTITRIKENQIFIVEPNENVKIVYYEDTLFAMLKDQLYNPNKPDIHKLEEQP